MTTQEVTITHRKPTNGSNCTVWNYDLNGKLFGQIWTYNTRSEVHPFHAKTLAGKYVTFDRIADADKFVRGEMYMNEKLS